MFLLNETERCPLGIQAEILRRSLSTALLLAVWGGKKPENFSSD